MSTDSRCHIVIAVSQLDNTSSNGAIFAISGVRFSEKSLGNPDYRAEDVFSIGVSVEDCVSLGMTADTAGIRFWMDQSIKAGRPLVGAGVKLERALSELEIWLSGSSEYVHGACRYWGRSSLDHVAVQNAYSATGRAYPAAYSRRMRDLQTLFEVVWPSGDQLETALTALKPRDPNVQARIMADMLRLALAKAKVQHELA